MTAQALKQKPLEEMSDEELFDELDRLQAEFWRIAGRTEG